MCRPSSGGRSQGTSTKRALRRARPRSTPAKLRRAMPGPTSAVAAPAIACARSSSRPPTRNVAPAPDHCTRRETRRPTDVRRTESPACATWPGAGASTERRVEWRADSAAPQVASTPRSRVRIIALMDPPSTNASRLTVPTSALPSSEGSEYDAPRLVWPRSVRTYTRAARPVPRTFVSSTPNDASPALATRRRGVRLQASCARTVSVTAPPSAQSATSDTAANCRSLRNSRSAEATRVVSTLSPGLNGSRVRMNCGCVVTCNEPPMPYEWGAVVITFTDAIFRPCIAARRRALVFRTGAPDASLVRRDSFAIAQRPESACCAPSGAAPPSVAPTSNSRANLPPRFTRRRPVPGSPRHSILMRSFRIRDPRRSIGDAEGHCPAARAAWPSGAVPRRALVMLLGSGPSALLSLLGALGARTLVLLRDEGSRLRVDEHLLDAALSRHGDVE